MLYLMGRLNVCKLPYIKESPYSHYFCRGPQQKNLHQGGTYRQLARAKTFGDKFIEKNYTRRGGWHPEECRRAWPSRITYSGSCDVTGLSWGSAIRQKWRTSADSFWGDWKMAPGRICQSALCSWQSFHQQKLKADQTRKMTVIIATNRDSYLSSSVGKVG